MSIKGATAQKAATLDEFPLPTLDDLPPTFEIGTQQPASGSASVDVEAEDLEEVQASSNHSSAESSAESDDDEEEDVDVEIDPEIEASHSDVEEVSNDAHDAVASEPVKAAATEAVSTPVGASIPVESVGKVAKIAKQVEATISKQATDAQKAADEQNAQAQQAAAEHAKVEADRRPEDEIASDKKLQDAKDAHKDQAGAEEKARLAALNTAPALSGKLAEEAQEVAKAKLPRIRIEAEKTLTAESEANQAAQAAAEAHKKADEEKAAAQSAGKVAKVVEVQQPTMQESVGKLPRNLAARFTEALAAVGKATDAVKVKVGTEEHGSTKALVTQFEDKNRQASEASKVELANPAPTHSIGKVAKTFQ